MENQIIKFSGLILILFFSACETEKSNTKNDDSSTEEILYFGQKTPGLIPDIFAPDIVSIEGRYEGTVSFSSDLAEMYFAAKSEDEETAIYFSKLENDKWTSIEKVDFTNGKKMKNCTLSLVLMVKGFILQRWTLLLQMRKFGM